MQRRGQYAVVERKVAPLYSEFARSFLERHFSPAVIVALYERVGTYSRGPRKGLAKGYVHWLKCSVGGWHRDDGRGGVLIPGTHQVRVHLTNDYHSTCVLDETANATDEMRIDAIGKILEQVR